MDSGNVSAVISAVAGISGVLLGNAFVLVKDWWLKDQREKQDLSYSGVILIAHLDRFATDCLEVAMDDGTYQGQPAGKNEEWKVVKSVPVFKPNELEINWRLLPKELMYSIIRIPDQQDKLHGKLMSIQEFTYDPPDHAEFFWTRQRGYAVLGLQVSQAIQKLASYASLPQDHAVEGEWNRDIALSNLISRLDEFEKKSKGALYQV